MGYGNEEAAVGDAVDVDTDGGGNVCLDLNILSGIGGDGEVDSRVGEGSLVGRRVEVLDQGGEGVELGRRRVPAAPR